LKKRYSKKRSEWKKPPASGSGASDVKKADELKKAYEFLLWLDPYIALRNTKSNLDEMEDFPSQPPSPPSDIADDENSDEAEGNFEDKPISPSLCTPIQATEKQSSGTRNKPYTKQKKISPAHSSKIESDELILLDNLQKSILHRNNERNEKKKRLGTRFKTSSLTTD